MCGRILIRLFRLVFGCWVGVVIWWIAIIGENTWVTRADWQSSINAYQNGSMTVEQSAMLGSGHWDAP